MLRATDLEDAMTQQASMFEHTAMQGTKPKEPEETRDESYSHVRASLPGKRWQVFRALKDIQPASNTDIAKELDWSINRVTGRVKELRDGDYLIQHGTKTDPRTGREVCTWAINPDL